MVHRDLKPENLFVTRHATGEDWCKVLDFGVAKMEASQSTAPGAIVGTIRYMAPEQLADSAKVAAATDVYALGAILYECLSGQPVHLGQTVQELMFQVMNQAPKPLEQLRPALPPVLSELVMQCLEKAADARPTLAELTGCLQSFSHRAPGSSSSATLAEDSLGEARPSIRRAQPRQRLLPALLLGLVGLAIGWAAGAWQRGSRAEPEGPTPAPARPEAAAPAAPAPGGADARPALPSTTPAALVPTPAAASEPSVNRQRPPTPQAAPRAVTPAAPGAGKVGKFDEANPYQE